MRYQTLLFDLDNTLLNFTSAEYSALVKSFSLFGVSLTEDQIRRYTVINDRCWKALELGKMTRAALQVNRFALFCKEMELSLSPEEVNNTYMRTLSTLPETFPGAVELCRNLSQHYALYAVTNATASVATARFGASGLAPWFGGLFVSEAVGYAKPDPRYFQVVLRAIGLPDPATVLVIGDSPSSDMQGGINAGLDTCFYNPNGHSCPLPVTYTVDSYATLSHLLLP